VPGSAEPNLDDRRASPGKPVIRWVEKLTRPRL
jgi:hypothetical protein